MIEHVGITGTQHGATPSQLYMFRRLIQKCRRYHGGVCVGADEQTAIIAKREFGLITYGHPPLNKSKMSKVLDVYDVIMEAKEYLDRNDDIAQWANAGIVIPQGFKEELRSGTWATYRRFMKYTRPTAVIWPDGTVKYENRGIVSFNE